MTPEETAAQCYKTALGGVDMLKDDEMQGETPNSRFFDRLAAVSEALRKAEKETGKKVIYLVSVTDDVDRLVEKARKAVQNGANGLLLTYSAGYSALKALSTDPEVNIPVLLHVSHMLALLPNISFIVLAKFARLCGADMTLVPTVWSSYQVASLEEGLRTVHALQQQLGDIRRTFPVPGGGLHPGLVPHVVSEYGTDIILAAGGGLLGHPDGATAGAKAMRQAVDAAMQDRDLIEAAEKNPELKKAIELWGVFERPKTPWGYASAEFRPKRIERV
jgi:2,3-diketo-5-methylthiopentyl-1-phosphate enolase